MSKENMNEDPEILLKQIRQVDAPPFLFTRIRQKIDSACSPAFTKRLAWSLGLSFLVLLLMNAAVLTYGSKQNNAENDLAQEMGLMPGNSLYK